MQESEYKSEFIKAFVSQHLGEAIEAMRLGDEAKAIASMGEIVRAGVGPIDEGFIKTNSTPIDPEPLIVKKLIDFASMPVETNLPAEALYQKTRDIVVIARRVIADQLPENAGNFGSEEHRKYFLGQLEQLYEQLELFEEKHSGFLFNNPMAKHDIDGMRAGLDRLKNRINERGVSVETKTESEAITDDEVFIRLKEAIAFLSDKLVADPNFDPRKPITEPSFQFLRPAENSLSALEIVNQRLHDARSFHTVYAPGNARSNSDIRHGMHLQNDYLTPAENLTKNLESRIDVLINAEFANWETTQFAGTTNPNALFLLTEIALPLPTKPYLGANHPQARIDRLTSATGGDRIQLAKNELSSIAISSGKLGEMQKRKIGEVEDQISNYVIEINKLLQEENTEQEVRVWETSVQNLVNLINGINGLPNSLPPGAGTGARTTRDSLSNEHSALSLAGRFDLGTQNELLRNKIINLVGQDARSGRYGNALKKINELIRALDKAEKDPANMSWEQLVNAILESNIDVFDHGRYQQVGGTGLYEYNQSLYLEYHSRRKAQPGETIAQELERVESIVHIVFPKLDDILQVEANIPTCSRDDLYSELIKRGLTREITFKALMYNPEYGKEFRRITDELILETTRSGSPIHYDKLTGEGDGRTILWDYIQQKYKPELMSSIYQSLPQPDREKKVDRVLKLIKHTYHLFDFLTIALAELQSTTKTQSHQVMNNGRPIKGRDSDVAIHWPDKALVHASERYQTESHQLLNWLLYLTHIPTYYGKKDPSDPANPTEANPKKYWKKLSQIKERLHLHQEAYYDTSSFTGKNGIEPTSIFDPIFADTRSYLRLGRYAAGNPTKPEMLVIKDNNDVEEVWGIDTSGNYVCLGIMGSTITYNGAQIELKQNIIETTLYESTALAGWKKILELTYGDLPSVLTKGQVVEKASKGDKSVGTGLLDEFINSGCGRAKMFPGRHMFAVGPLMTHYLYRIFSRIYGEGEKKLTFIEVIEKIQGAASEEAGLAGYRPVAAQILRNISRNADKWDDNKVLSTHATKFKMSDNLLSGVFKRRKQREKWIKYSREHEHLPMTTADIPVIGGAILTKIVGVFDEITSKPGENVLDMLEGRKPLPHSGVIRLASLFVEDKSEH